MLNFEVNTKGFILNDLVEFKPRRDSNDKYIGIIRGFYAHINHFFATYNSETNKFKKGDLITNIDVYVIIYDNDEKRYTKHIDLITHYKPKVEDKLI